jgi:hypothetical protein
VDVGDGLDEEGEVHGVDGFLLISSHEHRKRIFIVVLQAAGETPNAVSLRFFQPQMNRINADEELR